MRAFFPSQKLFFDVVLDLCYSTKKEGGDEKRGIVCSFSEKRKLPEISIPNKKVEAGIN